MISVILILIALFVLLLTLLLNYVLYCPKRHNLMNHNSRNEEIGCPKPKRKPFPNPFRRKLPGYGISMLVPFTTNDVRRRATWDWLNDYYMKFLPGAEIIVQGNNSIPFCKTKAVNDAYWHCSGDIIVILDADCYIDTEILLDCANQIRAARKSHKKLWFMPYRNFYRLTEEASNAVLRSFPGNPVRYPTPPPDHVLASMRGTSNGHWFGALIQVMPREAFKVAGGMDERFAGWGGEDVSFMRAVDTLYTKHKSHPGSVFHLWHPATANPYDNHLRLWQGQDAKKHENDKLMGRYYAAFGDRKRMQRLTSEHRDLSPDLDIARMDSESLYGGDH